jgi:hypothetical protein
MCPHVDSLEDMWSLVISADKLAGINGALDYAKPGSGKWEVKWEMWTKIRELLYNCCNCSA